MLAPPKASRLIPASVGHCSTVQRTYDTSSTEYSAAAGWVPTSSSPAQGTAHVEPRTATRCSCVLFDPPSVPATEAVGSHCCKSHPASETSISIYTSVSCKYDAALGVPAIVAFEFEPLIAGTPAATGSASPTFADVATTDSLVTDGAL